MNNILVIFNKENNDIVKHRRYIMPLSIILIIFSFFIIIPINRIIVNAKLNGNIEYDFLNLFIYFIYNLYLIISLLISIYYNYRSINLDIKDLKIENLLNTKIKFSDIVFGKYLNSLKYSLSVIIPIFPIFYLTFIFGGLNIVFMLKYMFLCLVSVLFMSAFTLMISSKYREPIVSFTISLLFSIVYFVFIFIFFNNLFDNIQIYFITLVSLIIMTTLLLFLTIKTKIFN